MRRAVRGMTLIEILVVLVLIGIVMGIVGGNFLGKGEKAKSDAAKIEINQIVQTLDLYKLETGRYPTHAGGPAGADHRAVGRRELERPVLEERHDPEGSVGQRVQVHGARREGAVRHPFVRRRRQGRRRWSEQGHHELAGPAGRARGAAGVSLLELHRRADDHRARHGRRDPDARQRRVQHRAAQRGAAARGRPAARAQRSAVRSGARRSSCSTSRARASRSTATRPSTRCRAASS